MPSKSARRSLKIKNFVAWIEVDDKPLSCYAVDIPNKRAREASCWIASEENKTFSVNLDTTESTKSHYRVSLSLDGTQTNGCSVRKTDDSTTSFDGLDGDDGFRPFKFTPLNITDEQEYRDVAALRPEIRQIGEITLRVHRITNLKTTKHKKGETPHYNGEYWDDDEEHSDTNSVPQPQKVHESSLKATLVPHQISLGDLIPNTEQNLPPAGVDQSTSKTSKDETEYYTLNWYTKRECLATFTFRYRPLHVLVDSGIVPRRALNPEPELSEDKNEGDNDEDMDIDDRGSQEPTSGPGSNLSPMAIVALLFGQSNAERISIETMMPTQTVQAPATQTRSIDNQRLDLPVIRKESEEPTLNLDGATVRAGGQPKALSPLNAIPKEETREVKLEEIESKVSPLSEDEEDEEERELRLKLEAIKERKRKNKELQRAEAAKRVKMEPENRFYFKPGEVVDLVSS